MSFAQDVWAHDSDEESCRLRPLTPVDQESTSWFFPVVKNASKRWEPMVIALLDVMLEVLWEL